MLGIRLAVFALLCVAGSNAQTPDWSKLDAKISELLIKSGAPSVSVAVVQNGRPAYTKAYGKADIARNRAADGNTRYAVGSISKQFTAAALLLLQEEGKISLEDKISKYFPEFTRANDISIRQLLSHTSGYEDYAPQDYIIPDWTHATTPQAILNTWAKKPLNFDPGTRWQYSNTNFVLAGEIFEKASGRKLLEFLQEKFFDPLGMKTAGDCIEGSPADATAYTRYALGPPRLVAREAAGWYFAAGELCMVPADLAKWDEAFLAKKILAPQSYEEFTKEVKLTDGKGTNYALGLSVGETFGVRAISHGGEVSGFLASNVVFPSKNAAVVVLSNEDGIDLIGPVSHTIGEFLLGAEATTASASEIWQVKAILEGLQAGKVDRSLFTSNANSYFSAIALQDFRDSLSPLGKLKSVSRSRESHRGGMLHRSYRAQFDKKSLRLNIYVTADGKYEQFLVEEEV
jgi:CubicO group peptidase (beta-lactamase class C family)